MIDDVSMLVDFDGIEKLLSADEQLGQLSNIKNDMIGCHDTKMAYHEKGLIETIVPMLECAELDNRVSFEVFTLLNSFLFGCPKALETLRFFR